MLNSSSACDGRADVDKHLESGLVTVTTWRSARASVSDVVWGAVQEIVVVVLIAKSVSSLSISGSGSGSVTG